MKDTLRMVEQKFRKSRRLQTFTCKKINFVILRFLSYVAKLNPNQYRLIGKKKKRQSGNSAFRGKNRIFARLLSSELRGFPTCEDAFMQNMFRIPSVSSY